MLWGQHSSSFHSTLHDHKTYFLLGNGYNNCIWIIHHCPITPLAVLLCHRVFSAPHMHQYNTAWCYLRYVNVTVPSGGTNSSCNFSITYQNNPENIMAELLGYDIWTYIAFIVLPLLYLTMHCYLRCKVMYKPGPCVLYTRYDSFFSSNHQSVGTHNLHMHPHPHTHTHTLVHTTHSLTRWPKREMVVILSWVQ